MEGGRRQAFCRVCGASRQLLNLTDVVGDDHPYRWGKCSNRNCATRAPPVLNPYPVAYRVVVVYESPPPILSQWDQLLREWNRRMQQLNQLWEERARERSRRARARERQRDQWGRDRSPRRR